MLITDKTCDCTQAWGVTMIPSLAYTKQQGSWTSLVNSHRICRIWTQHACSHFPLNNGGKTSCALMNSPDWYPVKCRRKMKPFYPRYRWWRNITTGNRNAYTTNAEPCPELQGRAPPVNWATCLHPHEHLTKNHLDCMAAADGGYDIDMAVSIAARSA